MSPSDLVVVSFYELVCVCVCVCNCTRGCVKECQKVLVLFCADGLMGCALTCCAPGFPSSSSNSQTFPDPFPPLSLPLYFLQTYYHIIAKFVDGEGGGNRRTFKDFNKINICK